MYLDVLIIEFFRKEGLVNVFLLLVFVIVFIIIGFGEYLVVK